MKSVPPQNDQYLRKAYEYKLCSAQLAYTEKMYWVYFQKYWKDDFMRHSKFINEHQQEIRGSRSMASFSSNISEIKKVKQEQSHIMDSELNTVMKDAQNELQKKESLQKENIVKQGKQQNQTVSHMKKKTEINVFEAEKVEKKIERLVQKKEQKTQTVLKVTQPVNDHQVMKSAKKQVFVVVQKQQVKQIEVEINPKLSVSQKKQQQIVIKGEDVGSKKQSATQLLKQQVPLIQNNPAKVEQAQCIKDLNQIVQVQKKEQGKQIELKQKGEIILKEQQQEYEQQVVEEMGPSYYRDVLKVQTSASSQKESNSKVAQAYNQNDSKEYNDVKLHQQIQAAPILLEQQKSSEKLIKQKQPVASLQDLTQRKGESVLVQNIEEIQVKENSSDTKEIESSEKNNFNESMSQQKNEMLVQSQCASQSKQLQSIQKQQSQLNVQTHKNDINVGSLNDGKIDNSQDSRYLTCLSFQIENKLENKQANSKMSDIESQNYDKQDQNEGQQQNIGIEQRVESLLLQFQKFVDQSTDNLKKHCIKLSQQHEQIQLQKKELKYQYDVVGEKLIKMQQQKIVYEQKLRKYEGIEQLYGKQKNINFDLMIRTKELENQIKKIEEKDIFSKGSENNQKGHGIKRNLSQKLIHQSSSVQYSRNNVTANELIRKQEEYQSQKNSSDYQETQKQKFIDYQSQKNSSDQQPRKGQDIGQKIGETVQNQKKIENVDESRSQSSQK